MLSDLIATINDKYGINQWALVELDQYWYIIPVYNPSTNQSDGMVKVSPPTNQFMSDDVHSSSSDVAEGSNMPSSEYNIAEGSNTPDNLNDSSYMCGVEQLLKIMTSPMNKPICV